MGEINVKSASEILDGTFQEGTERILYKAEDFDSDAETGVLKPSEARIEDLVKGKALPEGMIRTFAGKKFKKTAGKWLPYSEGKKKGVDEVGEKRKAKTQVPASEVSLSDNVKKAIRKMATGTITSAQIAKKMAISENQVNAILGKKGAVAKTQVPKGERAQPKSTDEAKVMAASAVKRLKDGGKMRGGDRVTEQAQKEGIVDKDGKVTAKGDKYLGKVQKPSQIKKRKKQVKDARNVTQVLSDAAHSSSGAGKRIYQHKVTRDQKRKYDELITDGYAEWKKEGNGDSYIQVTPLGYVQNTIHFLAAAMADHPNDRLKALLDTMYKEHKRIKSGVSTESAEEKRKKAVDATIKKYTEALGEDEIRGRVLDAVMASPMFKDEYLKDTEAVQDVFEDIGGISDIVDYLKENYNYSVMKHIRGKGSLEDQK